MLGINEERELITGPFALEIRERMRRIQSGKLSEKDLEESGSTNRYRKASLSSGNENLDSLNLYMANKK